MRGLVVMSMMRLMDHRMSRRKSTDTQQAASEENDDNSYEIGAVHLQSFKVGNKA